MIHRVDIPVPIHYEADYTADEDPNFRALLRKCPKLCRRYSIDDKLPIISKDCSASVVRTTPKRVVKVPRCWEEGETDAWAAYVLSQRGKIPYLVKVYGILFVPEIDNYIIRMEYLHTSLRSLGRRDGVDVPCYSKNLPWFNVPEWLKDVKKALRKIGLSTKYVKDYHYNNVLFDERNRPTWFDFSHYGKHPTRKQLEKIPQWDEERGRIVIPNTRKKTA